MTKAPPGFTRTLLSIAVPVTLQNLLASSFTLIDTMMIGKLGDTPLAAVGMAGKWTWFLTIVFFGFSFPSFTARATTRACAAPTA